MAPAWFWKLWRSQSLLHLMQDPTWPHLYDANCFQLLFKVCYLTEVALCKVSYLQLSVSQKAATHWKHIFSIGQLQPTAYDGCQNTCSNCFLCKIPLSWFLLKLKKNNNLIKFVPSWMDTFNTTSVFMVSPMFAAGICKIHDITQCSQWRFTVSHL